MVSEPTPPCRHDSITVFRAPGGGPGRMWSCAECGIRFYPACRTCVDLGHRGEEHVEPALDEARLARALHAHRMAALRAAGVHVCDRLCGPAIAKAYEEDEG